MATAQTPWSSWTPGTPLSEFRQIVFGGYIFPLTFQETERDAKLAVQTQPKMSFNPGGDYLPANTSLTSRIITIKGDVGSGLIGSTGNTLVTADDLEAERCLLAGLQTLGAQPLYVRPDRYIMAFLAEFDMAPFQDGGASRYATWTLKFIATDPRYFSVSSTSIAFNSGATITNTTAHSVTTATVGNTRAFPVFSITGACNSPSISIHDPTNPPPGQTFSIIGVTFSLLTMNAGDQLTVSCDPRPEIRRTCAQLIRSGTSIALNALQYINPSTDFSNNKDSTLFFPCLEPYDGEYSSFVQSASGTINYTASVAWTDRYL